MECLRETMAMVWAYLWPSKSIDFFWAAPAPTPAEWPWSLSPEVLTKMLGLMTGRWSHPIFPSLESNVFIKFWVHQILWLYNYYHHDIIAIIIIIMFIVPLMGIQDILNEILMFLSPLGERGNFKNPFSLSFQGTYWTAMGSMGWWRHGDRNHIFRWSSFIW